jgi:hypothetical protein
MKLPEIANNDAFSPESRIWVYTLSRPLTDLETTMAQEAIDRFVQQWTAHNQALLAAGEIWQRQYILLMVDESRADASGCSIDKSVHFLEQLGAELGIDCFDRMRFGWIENNQLVTAHRDDCVRYRQNGQIADETLIVNTLAPTKGRLGQEWLQPYASSWVRRLF